MTLPKERSPGEETSIQRPDDGGFPPPFFGSGAVLGVGPAPDDAPTARLHIDTSWYMTEEDV